MVLDLVARRRFPPAITRYAIWLYFRFTLSYRDVEELLAERGIDVSYEVARRWILNSGPRRRPQLRITMLRTLPHHELIGSADCVLRTSAYPSNGFGGGVNAAETILPLSSGS